MTATPTPSETPGEVPADIRVWAAVLDRIEKSLRAVDPDGLLDLEAEFEAIGGFAVPQGLGAMPEALLERAQLLLDTVNAAAARVAAAQQTIGDELARLQPGHRRPTGNPDAPAPRFVDREA